MSDSAKQHPTGLAASGSVVIVWCLGAIGVDMPPEVAAAVVGLVAGAVSFFTPRNV